jgi:NifU homolog involved in Fe-S cluster formation
MRNLAEWTSYRWKHGAFMSKDKLDKALDEIEAEHLRELREHYSDKIIQHWQNPHRLGPIEHADGYARLSNSCGEQVEFWLKIKDDRVVAASFLCDGCGCTIACASAAVAIAEDRDVSELSEITPEKIDADLNGLPSDEKHCAEFAAHVLNLALLDYLQTRREPWKRKYRK